MPIIKNHKNKNKYCLSSGVWVRDLFNSGMPQDINNFTPNSDHDILLKNEMKNATLNLATIDAETIYAPNVVIVSDGFKFEEKQHLLKQLSKVVIIGTNRSLVKWDGSTRMDWYVANNPYKECMSYLPSRYYPKCIVSSRTNSNFIQKYKSRLGVVYRYSPVVDNKFASNYFSPPLYYIDDYRNPICAAIALACRWEVQKLLLFCCDSSFSGERPASVKLNNGLYTYPQHNKVHGIIDGMVYWMKNNEYVNIEIADHSAGPEYENIPYIDENEIVDFFQ